MRVVGLVLNSLFPGESSVDVAEVGFAVADAEGEIVDVGDAGTRVGVSALR